MRPPIIATAILLGSSLLCSSCQNLSGFVTGPGQAYCGQIALASAYRSGFSPRVQLRLQFDSSKIDTSESPGSLSTIDDDGTGSPERMLLDVPLRPIPPLGNDALSELEFGDGRQRNLIYAVSPSSPDAESMLAFVSLRTDDAIEVRLVRGGLEAVADATVPAGRRPLFGVFVLDRRDDLCGF